MAKARPDLVRHPAGVVKAGKAEEGRPNSPGLAAEEGRPHIHFRVEGGLGSGAGCFLERPLGGG